MNIAVDLRSLSSGSISGVENYTFNIVEHLLTLDKKNRYTLFYNSFRTRRTADFHFVNSNIVHTHYPNKLLNAAFKVHALSMEKIVGDFDCLFLPNANHYCITENKKLIVTVHDLSFLAAPEFYDIKRRFWHVYMNFKEIVKRADLIFAVSEFTKQDLVSRLNVPAEKIHVVYSGIDHEAFHVKLELGKLRSVRNKYTLPGNFLLSLGTIEPRKNLIGLIRAFELLNEDIDLVIAGKLGWKYSEILDAIARSPKKNRIRYMGYIDEPDKPYIIKLAQALVYPSFYEGFGFPPLESMAVGVPVIASNVTSLPEVMGDAALLINPYNEQELSHALHEIVVNNALRDRLIAKGINNAQRFDWQTSAEKVLEGINSLG